MRDWISVEAERSLGAVLEEVRPVFKSADRRRVEFEGRMATEYERIFRLMHGLYGWRWDFSWRLLALIRAAAEASVARPKWLQRRDKSSGDAGWMVDSGSIWAMAYTERFSGTVTGLLDSVDHLGDIGVTHLHLMPPYAVPDGPHDGGYAVSSYRRLRSDLGKIEDISSVARKLDKRGIGLVLDFVANHTAHDHPWAEAAKRGEPPYNEYYFLFDDRSEVSGYLPHLREIFPDRGGDAFSWCDGADGPNGGKWVWTTFYPFQWDLDYRNPAVLVAMVGELLHVANLGASVVRMDATPFLWKREGTSCENLPEAHRLLQIMNAVTRLAAPSTRFLSEAIVHPDDVQRYVSSDECALGYNPLVMASVWEAVATRDARLLAHALDARAALPTGCEWITYLRSHDDIGWGFADEDAAAMGINPDGHRRFLNDFYAGDHPGTFALGERFQVNQRTGDTRISGTLASLAGLERALESADAGAVDVAVDRIIAMQTVAFTAIGIPMIYLGDEIGTLNDNRFADEPDHADDNRWIHRPTFDHAALADARLDPSSPGGRILSAVRHLAAIRRAHPALGGGATDVVDGGHVGVIAFIRSGAGERLLVAVNLTDKPATVVIDGGGASWIDPSGSALALEQVMPAYGVLIGVATRDRSEATFAPGEVG